MFIFLYGEDSFRSRQKLNEIIEEYKKVHKNGLNLIVVDCQSADFDDFKREIETVSMFKEKKLIILKNVLSDAEFERSLLDYKNSLLKDKDNTIVFFEDGKADSRKALFKFLEKNSKFQEFKPLSSLQLLAFAKKEFGKQSIKIQNEALEQLVIFCGNDLWRLSNEIKKLAAFKFKDKDLEVNLKDVEQMVNSEIETDIFKTIDSIALKNKKQALELIHKHLEKGDHPLYLLSMINFQFRNLLIIRDLMQKYKSPYVISKIANLHPYTVKKSYPQAQRFTIGELKKIYQKIFQADLFIKTGRIDPGVALDLVIAEI